MKLLLKYGPDLEAVSISSIRYSAGMISSKNTLQALSHLMKTYTGVVILHKNRA